MAPAPESTASTCVNTCQSATSSWPVVSHLHQKSGQAVNGKQGLPVVSMRGSFPQSHHRLSVTCALCIVLGALVTSNVTYDNYIILPTYKLPNVEYKMQVLHTNYRMYIQYIYI